MDAAPISVETLLAHRAWVRAVALAVSRDAHAADDVEQETWLAALRSPPRRADSIRGWLGAVVRSRARRAFRGESRRGAREAAVARGETTASAAQLAEAADLHRRVVQAVVELPEPYRQTILLRYFEGFAVDEVAARTGVPLDTARSRIARGLGKLRERLARELGDERPLAVALLPLVGRRMPLAEGGALMASKAAWGLVLTVVVAGGVAAYLATRPAATETATAPPVVAAPKAADASKPSPRPAPRVVRREEAPPAEPPAEQAPKPPDGPTAEEIVAALRREATTVDWTDKPFDEGMSELWSASHVEIALSQEAADLLAASGGAKFERLRLDEPTPVARILDLAAALKGLGWEVEPPRVVIVPQDGKRDASKPLARLKPWAAAPLVVEGRVLDERGNPVFGAEVLRSPGVGAPVATTDSAGRFEAKLAPPFGSLVARAPWRTASAPRPVSWTEGGRVSLDLELGGGAGVVHVRVVGDEGVPVAGAIVLARRPAERDKPAIDETAVRAVADARGEATLDGVPVGPRELLVSAQDRELATARVEVRLGVREDVEVRMSGRASLDQRLAATRVSFRFEDARPDQIVKFLNRACGTSIVLDPEWDAAAERPSISLEARDLPLAEALRALCRELGGATYEVQGPTVFIRKPK